MRDADKLRIMLELLQECGVTVRQAPPDGESAGALVRLRGQEVLFLDSSAGIDEQIELLAQALRGRGELEDRFLLPEIREALDGPEPD